MKKLFVIGAVFALLFVGSLFGQNYGYEVIDLGTLGGSSSRAIGINSHGHVVGIADTANGNNHAFLWMNGAMRDLGTLGGRFSDGQWINDSGQIVGDTYVPGDFQRVFVYSNSVMYEIGGLNTGGPNHGGSAYCINSGGQIVGYSPNIDNRPRAFLYSDGIMRDLGTLGGNASSAYGINDAGYVVGDSQTTNSEVEHAFVFHGNTMQDLGTLGGPNSSARGINRHNQIVGYSDVDNGQSKRACIWQNGTIVDIDPNVAYSVGHSINNHGHVVGLVRRGQHDHVMTAFLYKDGVMILLQDWINSDSGWRDLGVSAINDSGQITGIGQNGQGQYHAFLLNPRVPPPIIIRGPSSQTATIGSTVRLKVIATNSPTSYQWFFGTNLIEGATSSTLTLTNVQQSQSGAYTVVVSNLNGSVTSEPAMLNILPGLTIDMVPRIALASEVGLTYKLDYVNMVGPTGAWNTLATISITNNPQFYYDDSAVGQPARFYRLVGSP